MGYFMIQMPKLIVTTDYKDKNIKFAVDDRNDLIQGHHLRGTFYEIEELGIIEAYFPRGGVLLDVGSNVGNHAIFAAKFFSPARIIVIEPNPPTIAILRANIQINDLENIVDLSLLGIGLCDFTGWANSHTPAGNLGATHLIPAPDATAIRLARGDDLLADRRVDFIKMDVEGMELSALRGLNGVITSNRPIMFIEVDNSNRDGFFRYLDEIGYVIEDRYRRYPVNENFLVVPPEKAMMNGGTPLSFTAAEDTFLKTSTLHSSGLADSEKSRAHAGDTLVCDGATPAGDHVRLTGARLNGKALPGAEWFLYRRGWGAMRALENA